jgi:hypothetical protein
MPPLESLDRWQPIALWTNTGIGTYGRPVVAATPVQLVVRWIDTLEQGTNEQGEVISISATVVIDPTIPIPPVGSIVRYGWPAPAGPSPGNLMKVASYKHGRDIRNRNQRPVLQLERYNNSLPTAATS